MGSRASATYVGHNPVALAGADVTWKVVLTIITILSLAGFFIPSEFYDEGGGRQLSAEREIRQCTYTGQSYSTCFDQVIGR